MKKVPLIIICFFVLLNGSPEKFASANVDLGSGIPLDRFYSHYPPDPVNLRNGNFYLPVQDLFLPCFGIPLEVFRAYNSFSKQNGAFGIGWTFNYDIKITIGNVGTLKVLESDGYLNEYRPKSQEEPSKKAEVIEKIISAKKDEDKEYLKKQREEDYYDKMRIKLATENDYFQRLKDRYVPPESKKILDGEYYSITRGISTIVKKGDSYTRIRQNGTKEYYDKNGDLVKIEDRNGNGLFFTLDSQGKVVRVQDGCSHYIQIAYSRKNKITQITDSLGRSLKYDYDDMDRLISFKDIKGAGIGYSYNKLNLLDGITFSKGEKIEIVYDLNRGVVTEQKGPAGKETKYSYGSKAPNYKWAEVKDNKGYFESFEFYEDEAKTVEKHKGGKQVTTVLSRTCSKPVSIIDEKGVGEFYKYDDFGNLIEKKDPNGKLIQYKYEPRFSQIDEITDQGGNKLKFLYDERGNLTYANLQDGGWVRIRYEKHGKVESLLDSKGNIINFVYGYQGKPTLIEKRLKDKRVGSITVKYDEIGEIADIKYNPNDIKVVNEVKDTLSDILGLLKPSGIDFQI